MIPKHNFLPTKMGKKSDSSEEPIKKSVKLSDYVRNQLLTKGSDASDSEKEDTPKNVISLETEQNQLKEQFLESVRMHEIGNDGDEEFLKKRKIPKEEKENDENEYNEWSKQQEKKRPKKQVTSESKKFWTSAEEENEKFLRDYILNEGWKDKNKGRIPSYAEIIGENDEQDAEELEKMEKFETTYAYRHEHPDAKTLPSHPRNIDTSLRR